MLCFGFFVVMLLQFYFVPGQALCIKCVFRFFWAAFFSFLLSFFFLFPSSRENLNPS